MKVLVVNCYKLKASFEKYLKYIKTYFVKYSDPLIGASSIDFIVRDK